MSLLSLNDISLHFGAAEVLSGITLNIEAGMKVALVGENGSGKSCLLKLACGELQAGSGSRVLQRGLRISSIEQQPDYGGYQTALEVGLAARPGLLQLHREMCRLEARPAMDDHQALRYAELVATYSATGGYDWEAECLRTLTGLGIPGDAASRQPCTLSGGEQARLGLARALLADCDLLLLDEPDNHLDIEGIRWLEQALRDCGGSLVIASHDRELLDNVANCVVELEDGTARLERGTLADYFQRKQERVERQKREYLEQQRRVQKLREDIRRVELQARGMEEMSTNDHWRRIAKKVAKTATVRKRRIERELEGESAVDRLQERSGPKLDVGAAQRGSSGLLWLEGISATYGDRRVLSDVSLTLNRGQRIAITGRNGSGKSSLLKCILGELEPGSGNAWLAGGAELFYCDQQQAGLEPQLSLYEQLELSSPLTANQIHYLLARIGLKGRSEQLVGTLSGGERTRLLLSLLMNTNADLLLLDEPSNHLDLPSIEVLQEALCSYSGGVLLVSHDRHLVQHVATDVYTLRDGRLFTPSV